MFKQASYSPLALSELMDGSTAQWLASDIRDNANNEMSPLYKIDNWSKALKVSDPQGKRGQRDSSPCLVLQIQSAKFKLACLALFVQCCEDILLE